MADCEVIERFRLLRARIEWLVNELGDELRKNKAIEKLPAGSGSKREYRRGTIIVVVGVSVVLNV